MNYALILSCEHAGNKIPGAFRHLFNGNEQVLDTHEGWDPGAWSIAQHIQSVTGTPLYGYPYTRLLIEPNRSLDHPQLFSRFSDGLDSTQKEWLIKNLYLPYRARVGRKIRGARKPVIHLSIHTFTPLWHNVPRTVDIGLLFDPTRESEASLCNQMHAVLQSNLPRLQIRFNEPYLGIDDGLTTFLRTLFSSEDYAGIEIEVNQKLLDDQSNLMSSAIASAIQSLS